MTERTFTAQFAYAACRAALLVSLCAASFAQAADAPKAGQTVETVFPQTEARQAFKPDATWGATGTKNFVGKAYSKDAYRQVAPARGYGAYVYFTPGARTNWHMHPLGQTLLVVDGTGLTQAKNPDGTLGPVVRIQAGDVVICPPGIEHWHGAAPGSSMTHLATSESDPKQRVVWKEPVADAAYRDAAANAVAPQARK